MLNFSLLLFSFFMTGLIATEFNLLPVPKQFNSSSNLVKVYLSPTQFFLSINPQQALVPETQAYMQDMFAFSQGILALKYSGRTQIPNITLKVNIQSMVFPGDFSGLSEQYSLNIANNEILIACDNYLGFLRGIATFLQLVSHDSSSGDTYTFQQITINDSPDYPHRGLMLDTARHFISVNEILKQFPAMMINKLNTFHWHITDSDSFPLYLNQAPNLTQAGAFNQQKIYSTNDVALIVQEARKNGIMVIPEIDAPAHSRSWGLGGPLEGKMVCMTYKYDEPPCGGIDPTLNDTYNVASLIIEQLQQQFPSNKLHLGGDEVDFKCWETKPAILTWMKANNFSTYDELELYFRKRERSLLSTDKSAIYWTVDSTFTTYSSDDTLQYWGDKAYISNFSSIQQKVILSPYNSLYLDVGVGSLYGTEAWAGYNSWRDVIDFSPQLGGKNVIGAEAPLWSELNTDVVTDEKFWIRASALADRIWNNQYYINNYDNGNQNQKESVVRGLVKRLILMEQSLRNIGIQVSPTTSQYCALNPEICFSV